MKTAILSLLLCLPLGLLDGCKKSSGDFAGGGSGGKQLTVAMMPKSKGNDYFKACKVGADKAAKELNVKLVWDGPTTPDPAKQNDLVDTWITRGVDVIAVACDNRDAISSALLRARKAGITVVTYDADSDPASRDFFVNQGTPEAIGNSLMDNAATAMGNKGEFAIITASLTASNMIEWQKTIEARLKEKYPDIKLVDTQACNDNDKEAYARATTILGSHPNVKLIMAICSPAVPAAADAVTKAGKASEVKVMGLGLPTMNKPYLKSGVTDCVILWNPQELGYLAVQTAVAVKNGTLKPGATSFDVPNWRKVEIKGDNVILGTPVKYTKENVEQFDF